MQVCKNLASCGRGRGQVASWRKGAGLVKVMNVSWAILAGGGGELLLEVIISGTRAGLGIRIVGGINTTSSDEFGIFVKEVIQGSLAASDGEFVHTRPHTVHHHYHSQVVSREGINSLRPMGPI